MARRTKEEALAVARAWKARNQLRVKEKRREYWLKHKEREAEQRREWERCNRDRKRFLGARWAKKNRAKLSERRKTPEYRAKKNASARKRYHSEPRFAVERTLRSAMTQALRLHGDGRKTRKFTELLGCSMDALVAHLESQFNPGMSWENRGEWHIDHIRPCASFDLTDIEQQRACFHFTNLQPLWGQENFEKGSKWNGIRHGAKRAA